MCEFVGDDLDMKQLGEDQKKKLKQHLEQRKEQLQKRVKDLEHAIQKFK
jgi:chaperonin cofactor prefoldin